eukprot:TRINITY_DN4505_c1_g1_i1.p1 TRINITY_DN4505_c1_g1~~TRINITY_DN4505_c1_g1_i1.p1  ORF type:complete len:109 (-),score=7.10 TRINITY_DN4505_c1_g1_i1:8-334(-)
MSPYLQHLTKQSLLPGPNPESHLHPLPSGMLSSKPDLASNLLCLLIMPPPVIWKPLGHVMRVIPAWVFLWWYVLQLPLDATTCLPVSFTEPILCRKKECVESNKVQKL